MAYINPIHGNRAIYFDPGVYRGQVIKWVIYEVKTPLIRSPLNPSTSNQRDFQGGAIYIYTLPESLPFFAPEKG